MRSKAAAFFGWVFATALAAQDPSAPSASATPRDAPTDESISAAKRDLELIKAARGPAAQQGGELPKLALPEFQPDAPSFTPPPAQSGKPASAKQAQKKSANWLVDALEKNASDPRSARPGERAPAPRDREQDRARDAFERDGTSLELADANLADLAEERNETAAVADENSRRAEPPPNPLMRFMGDWLTPKDYALLKPVMENRGGASANATNPFTSTALPGPAGIGSEKTLAAELLAGADASKFSPPSAQENPYLQPMELPTFAPSNNAEVAPSVAAAPAPAPVAPVSPIDFAPPAPTAPKSNVPDFAKPRDDEKYFKQLKRF